MQSSIALMLGVASVAFAQTATTSEPSLPDIEAAQATTKPSSPTSNVPGLAFDRYIQVWLENTVRPHSPLYIYYSVTLPIDLFWRL